jgi:hypothetical protein
MIEPPHSRWPTARSGSCSGCCNLQVLHRLLHTRRLKTTRCLTLVFTKHHLRVLPGCQSIRLFTHLRATLRTQLSLAMFLHPPGAATLTSRALSSTASTLLGQQQPVTHLQRPDLLVQLHPGLVEQLSGDHSVTIAIVM